MALNNPQSLNLKPLRSIPQNQVEMQQQSDLSPMIALAYARSEQGNDGGKGRAEHHSPKGQEQKNSILSKSTKVSPTSASSYVVSDSA